MEKNQINLKEALKKTMEISRKEIEKEDKFTSYSPIYVAPTSNVKDTVKLYNNVKKALVVGSQGALIYELLLNGTTEIDCFDKNILQYLYYELLKTSIMYDDFKDFELNFTAIKKGPYQNYNLMLDSDMFFDLIPKMEEPARSYWSNLFMSENINKLLSTNLFRMSYMVDSPYLRNLSSIYEIDSFYKLQEILNSKDIKINYHICDITDIHKEFASKTYDLIMFDNILQYYKSIPALDNIVLVHKYVREKLASMLNKNGKIQLGYGFEVIARSVSEILGRDYYHMDGIQEKFAQMVTNKSIKEDFIPNMIKKYDRYDLDFIRGVETMDGYESENVVLTYKK